MKKLITLAILIGLVGAAGAQTFPLNNLPLGKGPGKQGWTPLAPTTSGDCVQSSGGTFVSAPCIGASGVPGGAIGAIQWNNSGSFGGFVASGDATINTGTGAVTIQPNAVGASKIAPGAANTFKGSLNGTTTSDIALTACTLTYQITKWVAGTGWQCGFDAVLPSRAIAATLNLSAFTAVRTLGYATAGDGGGATFKNVTTTPFLDSYVATGTLTSGGSGYVNGTYQFVAFTGGTGVSFYATVTVAGTAVTSVVKTFNPGGYGFTVNDSLTATNAQLGGSGSGLAYRVDTVTTPSLSFTDSAGNHMQYVADVFIDPRQAGAKFDWIGPTDAGATDDAAAIQAALNFGSYGPSNFAVNGTNTAGTRVMLPKGQALVCSALQTYGGTQFIGQGPSNTNLRICDAFANAAAHFVTLCDPLTHTACFGAKIGQMTLSANTANANANVYMLYTNNVQQARAIDNLAIYGGKRGCLRYDTGYGGAANFTSYDFFCTVFPTSLSTGIVINAGTTIFHFHDTIVEGSYTGNGVALTGGQIVFDGFHTEQIVTGIDVNLTVGSHSFVLKNATGGSGCTELVKLEATNTIGNFSIENAVRNGCTRLITNGQPGGANLTTDVMPSSKIVTCNPGAPCN